MTGPLDVLLAVAALVALLRREYRRARGTI